MGQYSGRHGILMDRVVLEEIFFEISDDDLVVREDECGGFIFKPDKIVVIPIWNILH